MHKLQLAMPGCRAVNLPAGRAHSLTALCCIDIVLMTSISSDRSGAAKNCQPSASPAATYSRHAGKGVSGDQGQCLQWFEKASEQYIPEATYKLAQCYEDGWGCPQDLPGAVELYKDAALGEPCKSPSHMSITP